MSVVLCAAALACVESDPGEPEPDPEPLPEVTITEGTTIGAETFPLGNGPNGGQGQTVDGIGCIVTVGAHYHAHLSLFYRGEQVALPAGIGITDPVLVNGMVENGDCFYWLHTHDATGVVHVEPPGAGTFTLGQLFDIWGQPLEAGNVAGFEGELSVFVDGVRYNGNPREIAFTSRKHISLQIGRPLAPIPMYSFPA